MERWLPQTTILTQPAIHALRMLLLQLATLTHRTTILTQPAIHALRMVLLQTAILTHRTTILTLGTTAPTNDDGFRKTAILV